MQKFNFLPPQKNHVRFNSLNFGSNLKSFPQDIFRRGITRAATDTQNFRHGILQTLFVIVDATVGPKPQLGDVVQIALIADTADPNRRTTGSTAKCSVARFEPQVNDRSGSAGPPGASAGFPPAIKNPMRFKLVSSAQHVSTIWPS